LFTKPDLVRYEFEPGELFRRGFDLKAKGTGLGVDPGDPAGLFWSSWKTRHHGWPLGHPERGGKYSELEVRSPKDMPKELVKELESGRIEGIIKPGARIAKHFPGKDYKGLEGEELRKELITKGYDLAKTKFGTRMEGVHEEFIQLKPGKVLAKVGKEGYKVLSLAGATALGVGLASEAQAEEPTKRTQAERLGLTPSTVSLPKKETLPVAKSQTERLSSPPIKFGSQAERLSMGLSTPVVQDEGTIEEVLNAAKEWGPDIAMFAGSSALAAAAGATGIGLPIAAGSIYTAASTARRLLEGRPQEETLTESLTGQELPAKEITRPFVETAENILFFGGGGEALRLAKKPIKGLLKGVQKVSTWDPLMPVKEAIWENVFVKPTHLKMPWGGGKTIQETLQPAIERIREKIPKVAGSFREARTQQALSREVFAGVMKESKALLPSERIELMKGLGGTPLSSLTSGKVKDILYRTDKSLSQVTKPQYKQTLMDELGKLTMKPLEEVESSGVLSSTLSGLFKGLERPLVGKASFKEKDVHEVLKKIIHNPRYKPEVQQFAKDIWNFSAQTPLDVAKALTHSSNEYIISKLMRNPGVVSSVIKPGYVPSVHPSIKGLFVHKDIELELEAIRRIPQIANTWSNKWFMGPWKTNKVILRPAAHFRNLFGNMFANDVYGGMNAFDPRNWKIYMDALLDVKNKGQNFQEFRKITGMTGRFGREEMDQLVPALKYGAYIFDKGLNLFDTIAAPARSTYAAEESWFKVAK
ncbi:MAG: hypothetical protein KJ954_13790, partial [Alphaproteobacteria bacterium]|nr:hypothetical protein [Alphaproteobacteria bacterium]